MLGHRDACSGQHKGRGRGYVPGANAVTAGANHIHRAIGCGDGNGTPAQDTGPGSDIIGGFAPQLERGDKRRHLDRGGITFKDDIETLFHVGAGQVATIGNGFDKGLQGIGHGKGISD